MARAHLYEMLPLPFYGLNGMRESKIGLRFSVEGGFHEYGGETISISPKHFLMTSLAKLRVGSRLIVKMRIPPEIPGGTFNEVRVAGVMICGCKLAGGNFGYQVEMEHH